MNPESLKILIKHDDRTQTFFHSEQRGKPGDDSDYTVLSEEEFESRLLHSRFPFRGETSVASYGGVSVCLKIEQPEGDYAVVARPFGDDTKDAGFLRREEVEAETKETFREFAVPQQKVLVESYFGIPLLLKMSKWIESYRPSILETLSSYKLSRSVWELSGRIFAYFARTGRIIDLSGKIIAGGISRFLPFTVLNSENILFEKDSDRVYLVDCGLWPRNHIFQEANWKLKSVILTRLIANGAIYGLAGFATGYYWLRKSWRNFFRSR